MLKQSEHVPIRGNVVFRDRSTLREFYLYIVSAQKLENPAENSKGINSLVGKIIIATEFEDGFLVDHLCYTDIYGNLFMTEDKDIQHLFENYNPSIYLMQNGVIIIYCMDQLYATVDMENFVEINVPSKIKLVYNYGDVDCIKLHDGTTRIIKAHPSFSVSNSLIVTVVSASVQQLKNAQ